MLKEDNMVQGEILVTPQSVKIFDCNGEEIIFYKSFLNKDVSYFKKMSMGEATFLLNELRNISDEVKGKKAKIIKIMIKRTKKIIINNYLLNKEFFDFKDLTIRESILLLVELRKILCEVNGKNARIIKGIIKEIEETKDKREVPNQKSPKQQKSLK